MNATIMAMFPSSSASQALKAVQGLTSKHTSSYDISFAGLLEQQGTGQQMSAASEQDSALQMSEELLQFLNLLSYWLQNESEESQLEVELPQSEAKDSQSQPLLILGNTEFELNVDLELIETPSIATGAELVSDELFLEEMFVYVSSLLASSTQSMNERSEFALNEEFMNDDPKHVDPKLQEQLLKDFDQLFQLFMLIPSHVQDIQGQTVEASKDANGIAKANVYEVLQAWNRMMSLLMDMDQGQGKSKAEPVLEKLAQVFQPLMNQWQQKPEWIGHLQKRLEMTTKSYSLEGDRMQGALADRPIHTPIFVPASFLQDSQGDSQSKQDLLAKFEGQFTNQPASRTTSDPQATKTDAQPQNLVRSQTFVDDLQNVLKARFQHLKDGEDTQIRVRLHPENLGFMDIRISSVAGKLIAQLFVSNMMTQELMETNMNQLRFSLQQQGLQVDRIEVMQQSSSLQNQSMNDQNGQSQLEQQQQQAKQQQAKSDQRREEEYLIDPQAFDDLGFDLDGMVRIDYTA